MALLYQQEVLVKLTNKNRQKPCLPSGKRIEEAHQLLRISFGKLTTEEESKAISGEYCTNCVDVDRKSGRQPGARQHHLHRKSYHSYAKIEIDD